MREKPSYEDLEIEVARLKAENDSLVESQKTLNIIS